MGSISFFQSSTKNSLSQFEEKINTRASGNTQSVMSVSRTSKQQPALWKLITSGVLTFLHSTTACGSISPARTVSSDFTVYKEGAVLFDSVLHHFKATQWPVIGPIKNKGRVSWETGPPKLHFVGSLHPLSPEKSLNRRSHNFKISSLLEICISKSMKLFILRFLFKDL